MKKLSLKKFKQCVRNTQWGGVKLTVIHAWARYFNFGDNLLQYGLKNIFLKYFCKEIRYKDIDASSTIFDKAKLKEVNKFDLFLAGGGGLIGVYDEHWFLSIPNKDIKYLKKPLIVYGIGYNNHENIKFNKKFIKNINEIKKKSISFSVRNDGSKERLEEQNLYFDEVPDPGFFTDGNHPRPNIDGDYVMLQIAYDDPKERNVNNDSFFINMVQLCKYLSEIKGYKVILSPHCFPDVEISEKIAKVVNNQNVKVWNYYEMIREDNIISGLGYYKWAKFVLAMRGHAQIGPIGMNVPVISIVNHPKHLGLLKKLKLEHFSVNVTSENMLKDLYSLIDETENNYERIKSYYSQLMTDMENKTKDYVKNLYKIYNSKEIYHNQLQYKVDELRSFKWKFIYFIWKILDKKQNKTNNDEKLFLSLNNKLKRKGIFSLNR